MKLHKRQVREAEFGCRARVTICGLSAKGQTLRGMSHSFTVDDVSSLDELVRLIEKALIEASEHEN